MPLRFKFIPETSLLVISRVYAKEVRLTAEMSKRSLRLFWLVRERNLTRFVLSAGHGSLVSFD